MPESKIKWIVVITLHGSSAMSEREKAYIISWLENQGWEVKDIAQIMVEV